jgi:hypothetical protein
LAGFNATAISRTAHLHLAVRGAAASDPAAAATLAEVDRQRLVTMGERAPATGQLAVAEEECRDVLWSTTDGTLWLRLVEQCGWSGGRVSGMRTGWVGSR